MHNTTKKLTVVMHQETGQLSDFRTDICSPLWPSIAPRTTMALARLQRDVLTRMAEVLSPNPPLLKWAELQAELEASHPQALTGPSGSVLNLRQVVKDHLHTRGMRAADTALAFRMLLEGRVSRGAAQRHAWCSSEALAQRHTADNSVLDPLESQLLAAWRALFPTPRAEQARLIGAAALINHHRHRTPERLMVSVQQIRRRYQVAAEPLSADDALLHVVLSHYAQYCREHARAEGAAMFEVHARAATVAHGPAHATHARPALTETERDHPIHFAWREEFVPTTELWQLGDTNLTPLNTGVLACPRCFAWLFDGETCVACMDGKIPALFDSCVTGETVGRYELGALSTIHDGPYVKVDDRAMRVIVDSDDEDESRTPLNGIVSDRTAR